MDLELKIPTCNCKGDIRENLWGLICFRISPADRYQPCWICISLGVLYGIVKLAVLHMQKLCIFTKFVINALFLLYSGVKKIK